MLNITTTFLFVSIRGSASFVNEGSVLLLQKEEMEDNEILALRSDYESSGLTIQRFAELKEVEFWKMKYALGKALRLSGKSKKPNKSTKPGIKFNEVVAKSRTSGIENTANKITIKTRSGIEIMIPI